MFCVIFFEDCDYLFRMSDKEINRKYADAKMEEERVCHSLLKNLDVPAEDLPGDPSI